MANASIISLSGLSDFQAVNSGKRIYEKQVAYEGAFRKKTPDEDVSFSFDRNIIDGFHKNIQLFLSRGVDIPVPLEHTDSPEAKRGEVVGSRVGVDEKGRYSLFLSTKLYDDKYSNNNVSIRAVDQYTDGLGNEYEGPAIVHLALTDYPVLPDLAKWSQLDASLVTNATVKNTEFHMDLKEFLKGKGIEAGENPIESLQTFVEGLESKATEAAKVAESKPTESDTKPTEGDSKPAESAFPPAVAASMAGMFTDNRSLKIDGLLSERKITPAVAKSMKEKFCDQKQITLSLSNSTDGRVVDGFDDAYWMASQNTPVLPEGERSGPQALDLSDSNPLIADAKRRQDQR